MTQRAKSFLEKWGAYLVPMIIYIGFFIYGYANLNATVSNNKETADRDRENIQEMVKTLTLDFKDFMKEYRENEKRRQDELNEIYKYNRPNK